MVVVDSWLCEMGTEVGCGVGFIGRNGWGEGNCKVNALVPSVLSLSLALDNSEVLSQRSALAFSHVPPWHSHLFYHAFDYHSFPQVRCACELFFLLDKFDYLAGLNSKWLYKGITTELVT